jgi:hypothetical protein
MATAFDLPPELVNRYTPDAEVLGVFNAIQGEVGHATKQKFELERKRDLSHPKLKIEMREYLVKDQFTNLYVSYVSDLIDGERYSVITRIGSDTKGLRKKFSAFKKFSTALLGHLRDDAFVVFGRTIVDIMKARAAAQIPVLINTTSSPSDLSRIAADSVDEATLSPVIALDARPIPVPSFEPIVLTA